MLNQKWYQSNDLDEELADAEMEWNNFWGGEPDYTPDEPESDDSYYHNPAWTHCPACGSNEVYGNGIGAKELACPRCGLQYEPDDYEA